MAINDKKISNLVSRQLPEFIQSQSPALLEFVKQYYTLLESAQITLTNVGEIDQILLETEVEGFVQLNATDEFGNDEGDYIIDEQSGKGEFIKGEIVTGQTSGQTAVILAEDVDNNKIYVSANTKFVTGETINGATSNATAVIGKYRANPVENITQLLEYIDIDDSLDDFFVRFKNKFLETLPNNLDATLDKKLFTKRITDLYNAKGSIRANKLFFQALFNETPEIYYPNRDMLRVSDGDWEVSTILKVTLVTPTNANTGNLVGQTITQQTVLGNIVIGEASAVVDSVTKKIVEGQEVTTLVLQEGSVTGTFLSSTGDGVALEDDSGIILQESGDEIDLQTQVLIKGVDNSDANIIITCAVESVIDDVNITSGGSYFTKNDDLTIVNDTSGIDARIVVDTVRADKIDSIFVETGGSGYAVGDGIVVNNTNTDGDGLIAVVSVVNGGFTIEGDLEEDGQILLESGNILVMEDETNGNLGDITDVNVVNGGNGYTSLPSLTINSVSGSGGEVFPVGENIGRITKVRIFDHGFRYEVSPTITSNVHMQVYNLSGVFDPNETVTSTTTYNLLLETTDERDILLMEDDSLMVQEDQAQETSTGTVVGLNTFTNILEVKNVTGAFVPGETVVGSLTGTTAKILNANAAILTATTGTVVDTTGSFTTVDGHVSENTKRIQDSFYYQDYSYVVKVGESINLWRDELKRAIHPAGFEVFGEVSIATQVNAKMKTGFVRINDIIEPDEIVELFTIIFAEKVGRRLGTVDDGTSLRSNATNTIEESVSFGTNTRDVTLSREYNLKLNSSRTRSVQGVNVRQGFIYAGPRYSTINRFASTAFDTTAKDSGITLQTLNNITISGTGITPPNANTPTFETFNSDLRTSFTIPAEISTISLVFGQNSFDETPTTFDNNSITFDTI